MGSLYLTDLDEWLRAAGLDVVLYDGWQTRARSSGGFNSMPLGVQWHHTASSGSNPRGDCDYSWRNSSDRPIGNVYLATDGTVWIGAAGASNTAGKGGPYPMSRGTVPSDQGNTTTFAIEAANNGVGQAWPKDQIDAFFILSNTLNKHFGNKPTDLFTHADYTLKQGSYRKIDPATASAVQGPWKPRSVNSSQTWNVDDVKSECSKRSGSTPVPPDPPDPSGKYTVKSGDSWWSISQAYGITVDALVAMNPPKTSSTVIHPGDVLNVPGTTYTVKSGDSWWSISQAYGMTVDQLVALNPPKTANTVLHPGDVLNVRGSAPPPTPTNKAPNGLTAEQNANDGLAALTPPYNPVIERNLVHNNSPWLQQVLCSMWRDDGSNKRVFDPIKVGAGDGVARKFGAEGDEALKFWQGRNGLSADGQFGKQTYDKMRAVRGK